VHVDAVKWGLGGATGLWLMWVFLVSLWAATYCDINDVYLRALGRTNDVFRFLYGIIFKKKGGGRR